MHPTYIRLLLDWAALQPRADRPPALGQAVNGCARGVAPCGPYAGLRDQLAAIASQQRSQPGRFQVVIDVLGAPAWAALAPHGCELPGTAALTRPLRAGALAGYRALIGAVLALGAAEGVPLQWWSPWNEPNHPRFISPQRASCAAAAPPVSPAIYAGLARAMAAELAAAGPGRRMILGELSDLRVDSPYTTSVATFVAALPADVLCLGPVWSIHAYAARERPAPDAVAALERALAARGGCAASAPVWVTEAGAGAAHPGAPRPAAAAADQLAGCQALARQLRAWYADPRVGAVFQYTFREDPSFPVGLLSADLSGAYPAYRLLLDYSRLAGAARSASPPALECHA